jgi:hypothetical protein
LSNYQTFNKNRLYVILGNSEKTDIPDFVNKARKRFRYNAEENILYKQCSICEQWFKVAKYENKEWIDIHSEYEIHFTKSGYGSYCQKCSLVLQEKKPQNKVTNFRETNNSLLENTEKYSVFLTTRHKKYLKTRAALESISMRELIFNILEKEINENPLDKYL